MKLNCSRGFSLIEVVVASGIVAGAIVFILRGFTTVMMAQNTSQEITLASFLAQGKIFDIEQKLKNTATLQVSSGEELLQARRFKWDCSLTENDLKLKEMDFKVSWLDNARGEQGFVFKELLAVK